MNLHTINHSEFQTLSSEIMALSREGMTQESIQAAKEIVLSTLPDLSKMIEDLNFGYGMLKFEHLPTEPYLPPSPKDGKRPLGKSYFSELLICGITSALELNVFAYKNEKEGALVHEIVPISNLETSISSNGRDDFKFHTDGAYLGRELRPSTLSLMCLVNEGDVSTEIVSLKRCMEDLSQTDIDELSQSSFIHHAPETFNVKEGVCQSSILDRVNGFYELKGAIHSTKAMTKGALKALQNLINVMDKNKISNVWQPGDLVVFNNLRTMHGRGEVKGDRWLQRCYGSFYHDTAKVIEL